MIPNRIKKLMPDCRYGSGRQLRTGRLRSAALHITQGSIWATQFQGTLLQLVYLTKNCATAHFSASLQNVTENGVPAG